MTGMLSYRQPCHLAAGFQRFSRQLSTDAVDDPETHSHHGGPGKEGPVMTAIAASGEYRALDSQDDA
jgi:hypothetical protein